MRRNGGGRSFTAFRVPHVTGMLSITVRRKPRVFTVLQLATHAPNAKRPIGPLCHSACGLASAAWFAVLVDENRRPRRRRHLHVVLVTAEVVGHVEVVGTLAAVVVGAALHVLRAGAAVVAADPRT